MLKIKFLIILFAIVLVPLSALAEDEMLYKSQQMYNDMQYEEALTLLDAMLKEPNNTPERLKEIYNLKGLCLSALGFSQEATVTYKRLLAIDPEYRLPDDTSPKLSSPFSKALEAGQKPIALQYDPPTTLNLSEKRGLDLALQADPLGMVRAIRMVYWREDGKENVLESPLAGPGNVVIQISPNTKAGKVFYYFEAMNKFGGVLKRSGTREKPFELEITPAQPLAGLMQPPLKDDNFITISVSQQNTPTPFYKKWWFWTSVGAAVVTAVAVGIAVPLSNKSSKSDNYYVLQLR